MFAVIFVVQPKKERWDDYLDLAKYLKPKLEAIDGFIDNERFESKRTAGPPAVAVDLARREGGGALAHAGRAPWRAGEGTFRGVRGLPPAGGRDHPRYRAAEGTGRRGERFDDTEIGEAKACTITEVSPPRPSACSARGRISCRPISGSTLHADGLVDHEVFESIYNPGKLLLLASGGTDRRRLGAEAGSTAPARSAIARFASFAITACSIGARRRNSIRRSRPPAPAAMSARRSIGMPG